MKIQQIQLGINKNNIKFKSIRTDKSTISVLKEGNHPILENERINILKALDNFQNNPNRDGIEFLLDVADQIKYGQGINSEFRTVLDEDGITGSDRENTEWLNILSDTVNKMITMTGENEDLISESQRVFRTEKRLNQSQIKILESRKEITDLVLNCYAKNEETIKVARFRQNLDYFIASSEISESEKIECLNRFEKILNGEYKINPQLEERRFEVADEMINDLIIKRPDENVLTIKDVSQVNSGICAAISICRKAIAYEDKVRYMDIVMDELNDKPYMQVYDVTELDNKSKKVKIPKIELDYDTGIAQGYRILDISAHNWMQNAHTGGDGSIITGKYCVFDEDNYGVSHDSNWYEGLGEEFSSEKNLLKALIKENEYLESLQSKKKQRAENQRDVLYVKKSTINYQGEIIEKLRSNIQNIYPNKTRREVNLIINDLNKFYKGKKDNSNEINVAIQLPNEVKEVVISEYLRNNHGEFKQQEGEIKQICEYLKLYKSSEDELTKLTNTRSRVQNYRYYRNLFNLAAAHRYAIESDLHTMDGVVRLGKFAGLPPRDVQISQYLKSKAKRDDNAQIDADIIRIEAELPYRLNEVTKKLFGHTTAELAKVLFSDIKKSILARDESILEMAAVTMNLPKEKDVVTKYIDKWCEKLTNNPSGEVVQQAARMLGYETVFNMVNHSYSLMLDSLRSGISEETFMELAQKYGGVERVAPTIEQYGEQLKKIREEYLRIVEKWDVPQSDTIILEQMEKTGKILSREKLDRLNERFKKIDSQIVANKNIENLNERKKANNLLYQYEPEEIDILKSIEKDIPFIKKYCRLQYQAINTYLGEGLEKQYSNIGKLKGQYWVREEGSAGLSAVEQLRIIEQMTGKAHYIEYNPKKAAMEIKQGKGGGIVSTSVDNSDYAFHAQYVPSVTTEVFKDPVNGEETREDIMWTDNTWGRQEGDYYWDGKNGFKYTDYGSGYGWKNGFILKDDYKIGLPVSELVGAVGEIDKGNQKGKFGLYTDMILPGIPINAYQKLYKMFSYILTAKDARKDFERLETLLKRGYKVDTKYLEGLDSIAENATEKIRERLEKEIQTREDFEKLPENDEVKFYMNLLSLYLATDNPELKEEVPYITTSKKIEKTKRDMFQEHIDNMGAILAKTDITIENLLMSSKNKINDLIKDLEKDYGIKLKKKEIEEIINSIFFDSETLENNDGSLQCLEDCLNNRVITVALDNIENEESARYFIENMQKIITEGIDSTIRIKSLQDNELVNHPLAKELIAAIDKYFNPSTDEELLEIIQNLQNSTYETADKFFDLLTEEDVGLNFQDPYELIKRFKGEDPEVSDAIWEIIASNIIHRGMEKKKSKLESKAADNYFRHAYVKLSELDIQKHVKKFQTQFFNKYKVRQAFPTPVVISDEMIAKAGVQMIDLITNHFYSIENYKYYIEVIDRMESIKKNYYKTATIRNLANGEDVKITAKNKDLINRFTKEMEELYSLLSKNENLNLFIDPIKNILDEINESEEIISGAKIKDNLNEYMSISNEWLSAILKKSEFINNKNSEIQELREDIKYMINSNVEPAHRNKAIQILKEYINKMKTEPEYKELEEIENEFIGLLIEEHITKNPVALLNECVKLIQSKQTKNNEYDILKEYLVSALEVAYLNSIQFKLVENQGEGINSKIKDMLALFNVTTDDGKVYSMDSDVGLLYLVNQLYNSTENFETLNIFLNQSGLSQRTLNAILNNYQIEKSYDYVEKKTKISDQYIEGINNLIKIFNEYKNQSKIDSKTLQEAILQIKNYVNRRTMKMKDNDVYKKYVDYLDSIIKENKSTFISGNLLKETIDTINQDAMDFLFEEVEAQINFIKELYESLKDRENFVNSIDVPEDSTVYKMREEYNVKSAEIMEIMDNTINDINMKLEEISNNL